MPNKDQAQKMRSGKGFVAALDQSGGSTPKALRLYGVNEDAYGSDDQMFDRIHEMRSRIVMSPAFSGERVVGAILFEKTMDRDIDGKLSPSYLWEECSVVPFLKIDKGLEDEVDGVRLMKPIADLDALLTRATKLGIFGTKMRSVIDAASKTGIAANVAQQFEVARQVLAHDLMPIIEPEVTISIEDKAEAEAILLAELTKQLDALPDGMQVMLKLSLPTKPNIYKSLVEHPKVMRVVALSGGYSRDEATQKLAQNIGVIASFSRALTEGLTAQLSDADFDKALDTTIQSIFEASNT